ncbi:hypothetical protein ACUTFY_29615, partial [Burkholderia pseudomallei]
MSVMSTNGAVRAPRCASETAGNSAKKNMPGIAPLANARDDARRHVPIGKSIAPRGGGGGGGGGAGPPPPPP